MLTPISFCCGSADVLSSASKLLKAINVSDQLEEPLEPRLHADFDPACSHHELRLASHPNSCSWWSLSSCIEQQSRSDASDRNDPVWEISPKILSPDTVVLTKISYWHRAQ